MAPPAAPARSSRPADRTEAIHNRSPSRSGSAASAVPPAPISARVTSCLASGASAGTASLVNRSAAPAVARAPSTLRPIDTPWSREVRGISDGPNASRAAKVSSGAAGEAITGLSHPASRRARSDQVASPRKSLKPLTPLPPMPGRVAG